MEKPETVCPAAGGPTSGFAYTRLALVVVVVAWQSSATTYGSAAATTLWLSPFGGVLHIVWPMLFAIAGFLACASLRRAQDVFQYLGFRFLRAFPPFALMILAAALYLGPMLTAFPIEDYLTHPELNGFVRSLYGDVHFLLPGVFQDNVLPRNVNPSLWVVPYAIGCHLILSLMFMLGLIGRRAFPVALGALVLGLVARGALGGTPELYGDGLDGMPLIVSFLAGACFQVWADAIPRSKAGALGALALSVALATTPYMAPLAAIPVAYCVMTIGLLNPPRLAIVRAELSYGIFLFAAFIQQIIVFGMRDENTYAGNFLGSLLISLVLAAASWFVIERPLLRIKPLVPNLGLRSPWADRSPGPSPRSEDRPESGRP